FWPLGRSPGCSRPAAPILVRSQILDSIQASLMLSSPPTPLRNAATERLLVVMGVVLVGGWIPLVFELTLAWSLAWAGILALLLGLVLGWRRRWVPPPSAATQATDTLALIGRHFPLVAWVVDGTGTVRSVHGGAGRKKGLREEEILGWSVARLTAENP